MTRKTDAKRIDWGNAEREDRILCRKIINSVQSWYGKSPSESIVIACSGGVDSTVLVHAVRKGLEVTPFISGTNKTPEIHVCYVNHALRPEENKIEIEHIKSISEGFTFKVLDGKIDYGPGIQERAREIRYNLLNDYAESVNALIYTAHSSSDNAETKLFQFITNREVVGIAPRHGRLFRPFVKGNFTRANIEKYAEVFGVTWCEDSSNATNKYSRNKIRHELIPWIKANLGVDPETTIGKLL